MVVEKYSAEKDIREGIKSALSRGETLKDAMQSFYNSGYKEEDVENAAKSIQEANLQKKAIKPQEKFSPPEESKPNGRNSEQIISKYEPKKPDNKILILIISLIVLFLIGATLAVFIFKDAILKLIGL